MIQDDSDLKRMFSAQREIDEGLAPTFNGIEAKALAGHVLPAAPVGRKSGSAVMVFAGVTITLSVAVGLVTWINTPSSMDRTVTSTSQADLQRINELCDSLLHTIKTMDRAESNERLPDQAMEWPNGTDSLLVTRAVPQLQ